MGLFNGRAGGLRTGRVSAGQGDGGVYVLSVCERHRIWEVRVAREEIADLTIYG